MTTVKCNVCGQIPMGEGCYFICPNSDRYYSPEQERADDADYGRWDRFDGWGDPDIDSGTIEEAEAEDARRAAEDFDEGESA